MKTLLFIISLFVTANSIAQLPVWIQETGKPETKLVLQQAYTKEEIVAKYGESKEFETHDDEAFNGIISSYTYNQLYIDLLESKLIKFIFSNKQIELRMECWGMTIKPGDDINKYRNLPKDKGTVSSSYDNLRIYVKINGNDLDEHLILRFGKDEKIRSIEWFVPV